jgi:hypothetical protein
MSYPGVPFDSTTYEARLVPGAKLKEIPPGNEAPSGNGEDEFSEMLEVVPLPITDHPSVLMPRRAAAVPHKANPTMRVRV